MVNGVSKYKTISPFVTSEFPHLYFLNFPFSHFLIFPFDTSEFSLLTSFGFLVKLKKFLTKFQIRKRFKTIFLQKSQKTLFDNNDLINHQKKYQSLLFDFTEQTKDFMNQILTSFEN